MRGMHDPQLQWEIGTAAYWCLGPFEDEVSGLRMSVTFLSKSRVLSVHFTRTGLEVLFLEQERGALEKPCPTADTRI